jgi:hypothetical protein
MSLLNFERYDKHKDKICLQARERNRKIKEEVMRYYSPELKCLRCGFSDIRALSIDHLDGKGAEHRRKLSGLKRGGRIFYSWFKKNNYPSGFQVLCMNCQFIKREENNEGKVIVSPETRRIWRIIRAKKKLKEADDEIAELKKLGGL